jgi:Trk K+ transport system NAD-binding subunit
VPARAEIGGRVIAVTYRDWSRHVIVCGLQGLGFRIVELLHLADVPVVVVDDDPDPKLVPIIAQWGVPHVPGSARLGQALWDAGLEGAEAVVCVEKTDLRSLETALLARQLRPAVRVVVQMANPAVGNAIEEVLGPGSVLDMASLAAPSVVEACVRRRAHGFVLGGEQFVAAEVIAAPEEGKSQVSIRHLYGDLAPVAVVHDGNAPLVVCPGRDHLVSAGDRVTLLGTPQELAMYGIVGPLEATSAARAQKRGGRAVHRLLAAVVSGSDRPLRRTLLAVVVLFVVSAVVIKLGYRPVHAHSHLSALDAIYFTVATIATIGFGDYSFGGQPPWLLAYGVFFMVAGVALMTTAFALFTNLLVSRRIKQSLGRQQVTMMSGHVVVVVGLGAVGLRVVEGLIAEGWRVVVVETDEHNRYLQRARALGVPVVLADTTQRQTLESVGLKQASAVALLTSNDLTNIEAALAARAHLGDRASSVPTVLRVFDRMLAHTVEVSFGFRQVRSTSALAAPWFVGAALGLQVMGTFYVEDRPFLVGRLSISSGSGLDGLAMQDLPARARVVAIRPGTGTGVLEHPPRRGTRFGAGDETYILGPYEELLQVLLQDQRGRRSSAREEGVARGRAGDDGPQVTGEALASEGEVLLG